MRWCCRREGGKLSVSVTAPLQRRAKMREKTQQAAERNQYENISDRQLRLTATVALVEDDRTIAEYTVDYKKTHSQTLLPMISEMMEMVEMVLLRWTP